MCGIAGEIALKSRAKKTTTKEMVACLSHRGPDGQGFYFSPEVMMGMRRLSIIDLSHGNQPLFNEDQSIVIVGNGEIYNYLELNRILKRRGHVFSTDSDIETAIHAYEEWGLQSFQKFQGMYALAIYDRAKEQVIIVRDKMGEKPVYYSEVEGNIFFASELKSMMKIKNVSKELDYNSIDLFFRYYFIPEPKTPFKKIHKLSAGSYMLIKIKTKKITTNKYWDIADIDSSNNENPRDAIYKAFDKACDLTLRADVPVGIALSGGIDSGAILAHTAPKYKGKMKAFSIGYEGRPKSDERKMAKRLADKYNVKFIDIEIRASDAVNNFPKIVFDSDDPIADIAAFSIYSVSKAAHEQKIKVLLGGIGGDEIFWGYPSTIETAKGKHQYNNPNPEKTGISVSRLYGRKMKDIPKDNYLTPIKNYKKKSKSALTNLHNLWLRSNCIALNDRLSMANSVELRSPFLDYELVEIALGSSKNMNSFLKGTKYWFKKAMKDTLPEEILNRPKQGFTPPVGRWLSGIVRSYSHLLYNGFLVQSGILHPWKAKLLFLYKNPLTAYDLYQMILLEIWGREFVWGLSYHDLKQQ